MNEERKEEFDYNPLEEAEEYFMGIDPYEEDCSYFPLKESEPPHY